MVFKYQATTEAGGDTWVGFTHMNRQELRKLPPRFPRGRLGSAMEAGLGIAVSNL